jgi:hypothetical protein
MQKDQELQEKAAVLMSAERRLQRFHRSPQTVCRYVLKLSMSSNKFLVVTESKTPTWGDRFIPNRSATDYDLANYLVNTCPCKLFKIKISNICADQPK